MSPRIGVIGSGFGAVAVARELRRQGFEDLRFWERADDIGGVWRDNTYPGAGCDVPSPLYSFSWARDEPWSRRYAQRNEILAYLRRVAAEQQVTSRVHLGREVVSARWDDTERHWDVGFADGSSQQVDVLVPAVGQLSTPALPDVPGIDSFDGPSFHSAEWDHSVDLRGRRIAAVGAGASAIQYVPHLAEVASRLTIFQRSAHHVLPKPDASFPQRYRSLARIERGPIWAIAERFAVGLRAGTRTAAVETALARRHLRRSVADPALRERLTPTDPIGCRRILFSNDYFPAVARQNVDLLTEPVARVTSSGVETADGAHHDADVVVYGTGFRTQDFLSTIDLRGRGGVRLTDQWADGAHAHLGIHAPGFPNLLISYGPNTNLGGGSIISMLEAQARHMADVLAHARRSGSDVVEVRPEAERRWDEAVQAELATSAWAQCDSWYRHASGRITSNWPGGTLGYLRRTRSLDADEFTWT